MGVHTLKSRGARVETVESDFDPFADMEAREAAALAAREREKRIRNDLTGVLSTKAGRRAVAYLLSLTGLAASSSHSDPILMAIASGRRDVGLEIADALERCRKARLEILDEIMLPCISAPRAEVSEFAPKMLSLKIPVDKIREVIGSGGKTIQKICADTGAKVDIDDDGSVFISAVDSAAAYAAKKMVDDICFVPEVGKIYQGKVVRILPIGAFVEIAPGHDGMVHISKLENHRVEKVEDVVNIGDMIWVKVTDIDEKGRVNLSHKDAMREIAAKEANGERVK